MKRKNFIRKMLSLLLVFSLVIGMIPMTAFATEQGYVYLTASYNGQFLEDKDGNPMAYVKVAIEDAATINLEEYGLSEYLYDADGDGKYETTALQLFIYVHEKVCGLSWDDVLISGGAGSTYFGDGLFGYDGKNLRYNLNGEYPVDEKLSEDYGYLMGATADHIILNDGDYLDVASFSCWNFYSEPATGFHHFAKPDGNLTHDYTANENEEVRVKLVRAYSDWGGAGVVDEGNYTIYYGKKLGTAEGTFVTDGEGFANIAFEEAGTWYLWCDGGKGTEGYHDSCEETWETGEPCMVSSPTSATVVVAAAENPDEEIAEEVIAYIDSIGDVTLEKENLIIDVRATYDALTEVQKLLINNLSILEQAEEQLEKIKEDKAAAEVVIELISSIGEVSLDKENDILAARDAYDKLSETQKVLVTNLGVLTAAESELAQLKIDEEIAMANKQAADIVVKKINDIGETVTLESKEAIKDARSAYDSLTDDQKTLVSNLSDLERLEVMLEELENQKIENDKAEAKKVDELIAGVKNISAFSNIKVKEVRAAYDSLTEEQKTYVTELDTLLKYEKELKDIYATASKADYKTIHKNTSSLLESLGTPSVGSTGGEWMVISFTRDGKGCPNGYYKNVEEYVVANINDKEQLHRSKGTDNSRVILALTSAGYDVTDVAGHNLLMGITDMTYVNKQGINGPIWALIAFDSHGYEIPTNESAREQVTREKLINHILDNQLDNGGWALTGRGYDPDITGMAIQALAPYYKTNENVKVAVDKALMMLSEIQSDNGGFSGVQDGTSSESCVQVAVALTSLGIDPEKDERFIKNGMSVIDAICLYAVEDGGFAHVPFGGFNGMATEQGQYALVSYIRLLNGQTSLYDMSDVQIRKVENLPTVDTNKPIEDIEVGTDEDAKDVLDETSKEILEAVLAEVETNVKVDKVVTDAIKKAFEEGKKVTVATSIIIEKVDAEDAEKVFGKKHMDLIKSELQETENAAIAQYLDLSVLMSVLADGDKIAEGNVSEIKEEVKFTVAIPDELKSVEEGKTRKFFVIRVHGDEVKRIETELNNDGTISFYTGLFSTYALAYEDVNGEVDEPQKDPSKEVDKEKYEAPKTGDHDNLIIWVALMTIAIIVYSVTFKKRKEN